MKKIQTAKITVMAVFTAIIAVISFLPIRTLGLEITLSMVPVAVGAMTFGPAAGAFLGGVFGVVSFVQCFGYSTFGVALLGINPFFTFIVCVPTRILAGWLCGLIFKAISKVDKTRQIGFIIAGIAAPMLNTALFMGTLTLFFYNTEFIQGYVGALGAANPIKFILLFVGINAVAEIIAGGVIAYPVAKIFTKAFEKLSR